MTDTFTATPQIDRLMLAKALVDAEPDEYPDLVTVLHEIADSYEVSHDDPAPFRPAGPCRYCGTTHAPACPF